MFGLSNVLAFSDGLKGTDYEWLSGILNFIESAMLPILIVLLSISAIYAIVLGVNMARAESAEQRDGAKKRIINFLIGAVTIIVILVIVYVLAANLTDIMGLAQSATEQSS